MRLASYRLRYITQSSRTLSTTFCKLQMRMPLLLGERRGALGEPILASSSVIARAYDILLS